MQTIPMMPLLNCKKFQVCSTALQNALFKIVCNICHRDLLDEDFTPFLRRFSEASDCIFYPNKVVIISILDEVLPQIRKIKRINRIKTIAGTQSTSLRSVQRRANRLCGTLAEPIASNPPPLMPQRAPDSHRQPNYLPPPPLPKKPPGKPPTLTE